MPWYQTPADSDMETAGASQALQGPAFQEPLAPGQQCRQPAAPSSRSPVWPTAKSGIRTRKKTQRSKPALESPPPKRQDAFRGQFNMALFEVGTG